MSIPEERRSGLGRPLNEVLEQGGRSPSPLLGMLESDPAIARVVLELLRQRFPTDVAAVRFEQESGVPVTRVAIARLAGDVAVQVSRALDDAVRMQAPRLYRSEGTELYVMPRDRASAIAVRRDRARLTAEDRLFIDLVARHVR